VIGDAPNYHLGLTRTDRAKKLAFYTVDLLTDLLDTGTISALVDGVTITPGTSATMFHHLFERPDGDRVLFVWTGNGTRRVSIELKESHRAVTEFTLAGAAHPVNDFDGRVLRDVDLESDVPRIFRLQR
jgi:hypothetical protein